MRCKYTNFTNFANQIKTFFLFAIECTYIYSKNYKKNIFLQHHQTTILKHKHTNK